MTRNMPPWVYAEHEIQGGLCTYCQRHYKSASNWAAHIAQNHQGVWNSMRAAVEADQADEAEQAGQFRAGHA